MGESFLVGLIVSGSVVYAVWTVASAKLRLQALQALTRRWPAAGRWCAPLQRRLLEASGCSACAAKRPSSSP